MNERSECICRRACECVWSHILFVRPYRTLTDRHRYSKNAISISAGNLHLDTGSSVRSYRLVRAMQLGEVTITTSRLSAGGGCQATTTTHVSYCRSCFPGWHFNMQPLGAVLAFVVTEVLLMAYHLASSSCKHMGHRNPVLRLSPSGSVIITDWSYKVQETRRAPR